MRSILLLLVAVVVQPPLVRAAMNGTWCPLYFAADQAIYVVNVDTTNTSNVVYRTPVLLTTTSNITSLNYSDMSLISECTLLIHVYAYRQYTLII